MILANIPDLPGAKPVSRPTSTQTQAVWATIILFLLAFWYGVGVAANAVWNLALG